MNFKLTYQAYGERSILVEWPKSIDPTILQDIVSFKNKITESDSENIRNTTNAYQSLLITYKNRIADFSNTITILKEIYVTKKTSQILPSVLWKIPVCYDDLYAIDLDILSKAKFLSKEAIIKMHTQTIYTVYFIGFLPGFLYLGGLKPLLHFPRKENPRLKIKKGAVAIGENQTGVYPSESPGGWNIIGNTPLSFFDVSKPKPCFASPGDHIQFYSVSINEYKKILALVKANTYNIEREVFND